MIAKITSPIPGPSTLHRPRRKTLRVVARGVVFIQRIKCVFLLCCFPLHNLSDRGWKGAQARVGAPNVRRNLPSELRFKTCAAEESKRQDRYSTVYINRVRVNSHVVFRSLSAAQQYYYFSWLDSVLVLVFEHRIVCTVCITSFT